MKVEQIGWYVQPEPIEYTNHYETAAWWQTVLVPAGEYPLMGEIEGSQVRHVHVSGLNGTITGDWFPALFGGVAVGGTKRDKDKGKPGTAHNVGAYGYSVATLIVERGGVNDRGARYVLLPEFRITARRSYNDALLGGGWYWMYNIVRETRTYQFEAEDDIETTRRIGAALVAPSRFSRDGYSGGYRDESVNPDDLRFRVACGHCEHITLVNPRSLYPRDAIPTCELCHNGPIDEQWNVRYGHEKLTKMREKLAVQ
jgi:hypothetical protein